MQLPQRNKPGSQDPSTWHTERVPGYSLEQNQDHETFEATRGRGGGGDSFEKIFWAKLVQCVIHSAATNTSVWLGYLHRVSSRYICNQIAPTEGFFIIRSIPIISSIWCQINVPLESWKMCEFWGVELTGQSQNQWMSIFIIIILLFSHSILQIIVQLKCIGNILENREFWKPSGLFMSLIPIVLPFNPLSSNIILTLILPTCPEQIIWTVLGELVVRQTLTPTRDQLSRLKGLKLDS